MPSRAESTKLASLFVLCCLIWLGIALSFSREIAAGLLPLLRWEIAWLAPQYELTDLRLAHTGLEASVSTSVTTRYPRVFGDRYFPAGVSLQSSTLVGHLLQPLVLMLSLVSTVWLARRRNAAALALLCVPLAGAVVMLDVPFVLVGALEDLVLASFPPPYAARSSWVLWMDFLNGGGRPALGIAAALVVVAMAQIPPAWKARRTDTKHLKQASPH